MNGSHHSIFLIILLLIFTIPIPTILSFRPVFMEKGKYVYLTGTYVIYPLEIPGISNELVQWDSGSITLKIEVIRNTPSFFTVEFIYSIAPKDGAYTELTRIRLDINRMDGSSRYGSSKMFIPIFIRGGDFPPQIGNIDFLQLKNHYINGTIESEIIDKYSLNKVGDKIIVNSLLLNMSLYYHGELIDTFDTYYLLDYETGVPIGIYGLDPLLLLKNISIVVDLSYRESNIELTYWRPTELTDYITYLYDFLYPLGPFAQFTIVLILFSPFIDGGFLIYLFRRRRSAKNV